uniref:CCR4-Not complex component Not1 C-terminal domain-containing protein n=1 Tax=Megaselia scalaris TaxID=36166 RepID=T1GJ19_MEGSC
MAGLNLNGPNGAFNFNNVLNTLVSTPSSPSRMMNANANSNSPFPMMMQQHQQQQQQQQQHPQHQQAQHSGVPRLPATPNPAGGHENVLPELNQQVSKEVEDEANSYFQRIYNHPPHPTLSIDEVLDMLQRFKEYQGCREQEVYHCMIRNLFEEYRFFPQYPEKELLITAQLFGGIIERNLVPTFLALGLALRCVLDALRKPEGYKMYYFGIVALDRLSLALAVTYVEYGSIGQEPPNKPQGPVLPPAMAPLLPPASGATPNVQQSPSVESLYRSSSAAAQLQQQQQQKPQPIQQQQSASIASQPISSRAVKSIATATNIDTLLSANTEREEKVTNPPDSVADKTAFIFNNLSQLNLQQKCEEIKEIMTQEYWPWLSQYLVLKRASIELNFHSLYSNFLDAMKNKEVLRLVTRETFRNIRVLLRSEKHVNNFSDRTLLKNLGHWLGMMTLARNRPILAIDIDLKSLLVEAFHKGQQELLFIVPFVAKVLESCSKSKIFKPPNPWTMAIMNVLGELHTEPDLKLNLKFEIEDPDRIRSIELQLSQPKPPAKMQEITQADLQMAQALQQHQSFRNMDDSTMVLLNNPSIVSNPSPSISNDSAGASTGVCGQVVNQPPPEPKFSYIDLVINNYNSLSQYLVINPAAIGILANNPALKHTLTTAIERTITEWLQPLVDRSVRIAVQTTEQIVRKDFALDHDENRMRIAAHHMVRNLASGMAMITCKDQLIQALTTNLRKAFVQNAQSYVGFQDSIEAACNQLAQDNHELVCAFMQKTAGEKALPEIDRRIAHDFEVRKTAREEGRRYCEAESLTYQAERMPEQVRLKMGAASNQQFAVYTELLENYTTQQNFGDVGGNASAGNNTADEMSLVYSDLASKIEAFITNAQQFSTLQLQLSKMHALLKALVNYHRVRDNDSGFILVTRVVEALIEGLTNNISADQIDQMKLYRNICLRTLTMFQSTFGASITERVVTKCVLEIREDVRYNLEAMKLLISSRFINMQHFDNSLIALMESGNYLAITFSMQIVQHFLIDERGNTQITEQDFCNTIEMLARLAQVHRGPEGLGNLIEHLRINHDPNMFSSDRMGPTQFIHSGMNSVRQADCDDPPDLHDKTVFLLKDWCTMNLYGILKTDDLITRFFRQATQFCIDIVYMNPEQNPANHRQMIFKWMDAYVKLIILLFRHSGEASNPATKINLLNKVLGIVVGVLLQDQEVRGVNFQQIGYQRFFTMLFIELSSSDPVIESVMLSVVTAFSHAYHFLNPSCAPGFAYAWLELVSHRVFLSRILAQIPQQKGWPLYCQLLLDLFKYLAPFLRNTELAKPVQILYKGTLRVLLVLLHDFPEFLCDYHFAFCDVIPSNCIQMRNIILAAFPRNMRLPDPFTPNLKAHMLLETGQAPKIFSNYVSNIEANFKKNLDSYLKARSPVTFLSEIRTHLQSSKEPGSVYNIPLINALVFTKNQVPNASNIASSAHIDIFQNLAVDLDHEGRYLFLNAIANQLRYPNSHTQYFSCVVLHLFAQANTEAIQEQITRVLLERLIVNRPHPWGLLVTFIELIKEPVYKFWDHEFVHCAPEIEK